MKTCSMQSIYRDQYLTSMCKWLPWDIHCNKQNYMIDNITHNIFFFIHPVITFQQFPSNAQHFFSLTGRIALTLFFKFSKNVYCYPVRSMGKKKLFLRLLLLNITNLKIKGMENFVMFDNSSAWTAWVLHKSSKAWFTCINLHLRLDSIKTLTKRKKNLESNLNILLTCTKI